MEYDISELRVGDEISVAECEALTQLDRGHCNYPMALVGLAKTIEASLWRVGKQWTVCCKNDAIRILTHVEATEYNDALYEAGKRKMRLAHRRAAAIDLEQLPEDVRKAHIENLTKQGRVISFMRTRTKMVLNAIKKVTPTRS